MDLTIFFLLFFYKTKLQFIIPFIFLKIICFTYLFFFLENVELVKKYGKGAKVITSHYKGGIREKVKNFQKSKALINFSPILNGTCQCEPITDSKVPKYVFLFHF